MSLLADNECPKVDFENVELKENENNGRAIEAGKGKKDGDKYRSLCFENIFLVLLICFILIGIILGIVLGFVLGKAKEKKATGKIPTDYYLPSSLIPKHYVLETQPYIIPDHFTFDGKVEILVDCVEETKVVVLHSKYLTIVEEDVRVRDTKDNYYLKVSGVEYNETRSFLILHLGESLHVGNEYLIILRFSGELQTSGKGFYVSSYNDDKDETHYVASTQYEAIHAREGFPCFDEPGLKATFEVTIVRWRNMSSLSNMPRIKTERRGTDWEADTFLTTLKMSTYLVAYYIGEYEGKIKNKVRVWAPNHQIDNVDFSLELGNKALALFENKLGVPYGPPKLDMIPVSELVAAAMENWGLIIYMDSTLLYSKDKADAEVRQEISTTVLHEIAHQWFGNLVTPKWWSDIWLSEGMTTYMEYIASTAFFPEWNKINKAIRFMYSSVIERDCSSQYIPTVWKNITAEQITLPGETFGEMTYRKGAVIGHMMHTILGNETFWRGISAYLKDYSYRNVEEKDIWKHLTAAQFGNNKIDMEKVMWSWTHTKGSPIVEVRRDYNQRKATFTQHTCRTKFNEDKDDLWHIPISYNTPRNLEWNLEIQEWLTEREMTIRDMPKENEWLLVNGQSVGYYIVNYDKRNWELLAEQLRVNHEVFSADQRYKILADANILYKFELLSVEMLFDLSSYLGKETVFSMFEFPNANFLSLYMSDLSFSSYRPYWIEFVISIFAPIQERLGWEIDKEKDLRFIRQLKVMSNRHLCNFNYRPCVEEAITRFYVYKLFGDNQTEVASHNRDYVLCASVRSGPPDVADYFIEQYLLGKGALDYLGCSENSSIIDFLFDLFDNGWESSYSSVVQYLLGNAKYWEKFIVFLDEYFELADDSEVNQWISAAIRRVPGMHRTRKLRELIRKYYSRLDKKRRYFIDDFLEERDWEKDEEAKIDSIGEWLKKRKWVT